MSLQDGSKDQSVEPAPMAAEEESVQEELAPIRARYEQSHPGKSRQGDLAGSEYHRLHSDMQDSKDLISHATSNISAGESTYSYGSTRDFSAYFREIDGRKFSSQASTYMLPADETEFGRLDKQHAAFLIGLGGLYPCPDLVERALSPRPGETIEIVDLGCGTGIWALSMARRFPHAQIVGIDITPNPIGLELLPPNIRFEIDDINLGLSQYAGRFDFVHMRCVGGGLPDYAQAITYAAQCVKPGGVLVVVELDTVLCAEDKVSLQKMATPDQPDGSWLQRFFYEFRWAYVVNGVGADFDHILDKGLWDHPLLDACGAAAVHIPLGPWAKSSEPEEAQRLELGGIFMRQNIKSALQACQTVMRKNGIPQNVLDELVREGEAELESLDLHSWVHLRLLWGQRNNAQADGSVPLTSASICAQILNLRPSTWVPHRQVRIYQTAEECQDARKKRLDTIGELVTPMVLKIDA